MQSSTFAADERPNFLIISIDDLKSVVGVLADEPGNFLTAIYPDEEIRSRVREVLTPNIDRFAAQSTVFSDAHTIYPICNPSRIALWTGTRPNDTGLDTNNGVDFRRGAIGAKIVTLQQNLRENGYYTTGLGKVFHSPRGGTDDEYSWDVWINRAHGAKGPWRHSRYSSRVHQFQFGTSLYAMDEQHDIVNADHVARLMQSGTSSLTSFGTDNEIYVTLPEDAPFLINLGIYLPHAPFVAPQEALELFDVDDMDLTREKLDAIYVDLADLSAQGKRYATTNTSTTSFNGAFTRILKYGLRYDRAVGDIAAWKEIVRHYLAAVVVADRAVGRVLSALDQGGYADNTIVVIHSDHGFNLGEKNVLGKNVLWDDSTRSLFLLRRPGQAAAVIDETVSLQDIYPTVSALAGVPTPSYVPYTDLTPLLEDEYAVSSKPVLSVQGRRIAKRYAVITERYLYTRYGTNPNNAELYDRHTDPDQIYNLIQSNDYQILRATLDRVMEQLLKNVDAPPVILPLSPQDIEVQYPIQLSVSAWHVKGDSLQYSASSLPPGITLNANNGVFGGRAVVDGLYDSVVTVSSKLFSSSVDLQWNVTGSPRIDMEIPSWENAALSIDSISPYSVELSWSGSMDDIDVVSWNVYLDDGYLDNVTQSSIAVDGLAPNTAYTVGVQALDSMWNESINGPLVDILTPEIDFEPPTWLSSEFINITDLTASSATIDWTAATDNVDVKSYVVQLIGSSTSISAIQPMSVLTGLEPETEYVVEIYAKDSSENLSQTPISQAFTTLASIVTVSEGEVIVTIGDEPVAVSLDQWGQTSDRGTATVLSDTISVEFSGNIWKKLDIDYPITPATRMSFEFSSSIRAERQGIGFSNRRYLSATRYFDLNGSENFGKKHFSGYQNQAPQVVNYDIPVGQFFTGEYKFLVLVNDHDRSPANGQSIISNIVIYENVE